MEALESKDLQEPANLARLVGTIDQILFLVASDLSAVYFVNDAYRRVTGYDPEQLFHNPRAWAEIIVEEDRQRVMQAVTERVSGKRSSRSEIEYRIRTMEGELRWLRAVITPSFDESRGQMLLAGCVEDVTERKRAEFEELAARNALQQAVQDHARELSETVLQLRQEGEQRQAIADELRRTTDLFRKLFEASIFGILFSDIYGRIFDANQAFLSMTGYSRDDLPLRWDLMTPPEWSHMSDLAVQRLFAEGSTSAWEKEYLRKDGTRIPVLLGTTMLDRDSGQCVTYVIDLTSRKAVEEQVREVNAQLDHASRLGTLGVMLADLAHEIHQPLGVISNYASGTLRRLHSGELAPRDLEERLKEITAESMRVADVIRNIRDFIRVREPERKPIELNELVMDAMRFTRLERRGGAVEVLVRADRNLKPVLADRVQIIQVLVNLILNALSAIGAAPQKRGLIIISTYENAEKFAEIAVADNGVGIKPGHMSKIFDRFFTTKPTGLGLGLAISRANIRSHGGELWCDSTPGDTTVFRLTLPFAYRATEA